MLDEEKVGYANWLKAVYRLIHLTREPRMTEVLGTA